MKFLVVLFVGYMYLIFNSHGYPHDDTQDVRGIFHKETGAGNPDNQLKQSQHRVQQNTPSSEEPLQEATFYPSFPSYHNPHLGHSGSLYFQQEGAYSQRTVTPYQQQLTFDRFSEGGDSFIQSSENNNYGLLGSGNFGIIPGGTFFNDNDGESSNVNQQLNSYYHNGHGRPSWYAGGLPNPRPVQHQQFADFRDFADINTPSYSQFVVVYANKNSSSLEKDTKRRKPPKNILEQLALLDIDVSTTTEITQNKLSKSKKKLAKILTDKKIKRKTTTASTVDLNEPLLALS